MKNETISYNMNGARSNIPNQESYSIFIHLVFQNIKKKL
jgi:hypothetical protein